MEFFIDVLYKIIIAIIVGLLSFLLKPVRKKFLKSKLYSYIMRKLGKEKYKVIVTGRVYHRSDLRIHIKVFKVELPYEDISDRSMPIDESNHLIFQAVNKKYGEDYNSQNYWLNHISPRNVTYYKEDGEVQ